MTFKTILSKDPILAKIVQETPEYKTIDWEQDVYLALISSIISQQISTKVARVIMDRFLGLFEEGYPEPNLVLKKTEEELRSAGLSGQKLKYIRNVATFATENDVNYNFLDQQTDEEIISYLTQIKGIGVWTVHMVLMFVFERPDVLPLGDLAVRQKMAIAYGVESKGKELHADLTTIAENWRPFRSQACKYFWRWQPDTGG